MTTSPEPKPYAVASDLVSAFARDGAVCLRGLLSPAEVTTLTAGINHNLAHLSPRALVASQPSDPGHFVEDFCNWQDNPHYRATALHTALPAAAAALMQSTEVRLYHDHMLTKEPGTRQPTPWHQDQPYYNVVGQQNISFWIPVDAVPRASTLEFVAGSHKGPWLMPRTFLTQQARWFAPGTLAELPDIQNNRADHPIIGWALQPGDAVAFHMLTLHATAGVGPSSRRRVFSVRYLGDDMRHAPRPWTTSPPFDGLANRLADGAVMDDPLFPLVWPC